MTKKYTMCTIRGKELFLERIQFVSSEELKLAVVRAVERCRWLTRLLTFAPAD